MLEMIFFIYSILFSFSLKILLFLIGAILDFNMDVTRMFGFGSWELKNQNIKLLMPSEIAEKVHRLLLLLLLLLSLYIYVYILYIYK